MSMPTQRCRFGPCSARIIWATTYRGRDVPLDADPVAPGTKNALVLIGEVAFSLVPAVTRIAHMFGVDEAEAFRRAHEEYGWHLTHFAKCPHADKHRRRR